MIATKCVSHVVYYSWEREASLKFFVEVFGFYPQIRENVWYCGMGDTLIEIFKSDPPEAELQWKDYIFGLEVPDVEEALKELEPMGIKVLRPLFIPVSFYGRQAVIDVPGGMPMAIRDYREGDGPHFNDWKPRPQS